MIGVNRRTTFCTEPSITAGVDRLGPGVGEGIGESIRVTLIQLKPRSVVGRGSGAAVVESRRNIGVQGSRLRIARTRCQGGVVVAACNPPMRGGAYVVGRDGGGRVELTLDTDVPLFRVSVLDVGIVEPLHLVERGSVREEPASRTTKRILHGHGRGSRSRTWLVLAVRDQLTDIGAGTFDVLRHLGHSGPVAIDDAETGMNRRLFSQAIGQTEARPPVASEVVSDLAARIDDHVSGELTGGVWDAGREASGCTGRWKLLQNIGSISEVHVAGLDSAILTDGVVGTIRRKEGVVVAKAPVDSEPRRRLPGILEEEVHHATGPCRFVYIAAVGSPRDAQQETGQSGTSAGGVGI